MPSSGMSGRLGQRIGSSKKSRLEDIEERAADSYGEIAISMDALFDMALAGSDGALEALRYLADMATERAVKWSMARKS